MDMRLGLGATGERWTLQSVETSGSTSANR
jgi:hypothetical protein